MCCSEKYHLSITELQICPVTIQTSNYVFVFQFFFFLFFHCLVFSFFLVWFLVQFFCQFFLRTQVYIFFFSVCKYTNFKMQTTKMEGVGGTTPFRQAVWNVSLQHNSSNCPNKTPACTKCGPQTPLGTTNSLDRHANKPIFIKKIFLKQYRTHHKELTQLFQASKRVQPILQNGPAHYRIYSNIGRGYFSKILSLKFIPRLIFEAQYIYIFFTFKTAPLPYNREHPIIE